jgi:ABC-type transporter Mla MlaB component
MPQLCLQVSRRRDAIRVAVIGRLDRHTAAGFTDHVLALLHHEEPGARMISVDLRCCIHVDAAGAAALTTIREAAAGVGTDVRLSGLSPLTEAVVHVSADVPREETALPTSPTPGG